MKRMMAVVLMVLLVFTVGSGFAETDFSTYTFDELLEVKTSLENEIASRPENSAKTLSEGEYIAGKDLPVGTYLLSLNQEDEETEYVKYYVYETRAMYEYDVDRLCLGDMSLKEGSIKRDGSAMVDLYEGYCLVAYRNGINVQLEGKLEGNPDDGYEVPEGTEIPVGVYTIGDDIPEGKYTIHYGGAASSRYRLYSSMEEATDLFGDKILKVILSRANPSGAVNLKEGQVIKIEYNSIIMKKSQGFVFD